VDTGNFGPWDIRAILNDTRVLAKKLAAGLPPTSAEPVPASMLADCTAPDGTARALGDLAAVGAMLVAVWLGQQRIGEAGQEVFSFLASFRNGGDANAYRALLLVLDRIKALLSETIH
jgi:hypothetical protein